MIDMIVDFIFFIIGSKISESKKTRTWVKYVLILSVLLIIIMLYWLFDYIW